MIINTAVIMQNMKIILKKSKKENPEHHHHHHMHHNFGWGLHNPMDQSMKIDYVENIPKQHNNYDCGIYLMSFAESIVQNYLQREGNLIDLKEYSPGMLAHIDEKYVYNKRLEIRSILFNMIKKHSNVYD